MTLLLTLVRLLAFAVSSNTEGRRAESPASRPPNGLFRPVRALTATRDACSCADCQNASARSSNGATS